MEVLYIFLFSLLVFRSFQFFDGLTTKVEVYRESFWWRTDDGNTFSTAIIYKSKHFPVYEIRFDCKYKHPAQHPNYEKFLEKFKSIKENGTT